MTSLTHITIVKSAKTIFWEIVHLLVRMVYNLMPEAEGLRRSVCLFSVSWGYFLSFVLRFLLVSLSHVKPKI